MSATRKKRKIELILLWSVSICVPGCLSAIERNQDFVVALWWRDSCEEALLLLDESLEGLGEREFP